MAVPASFSRWLVRDLVQFGQRLFGSGDQALARTTEPTRRSSRRKGSNLPQLVSCPSVAELAQLPDDHLVAVHTRRILLGRLLMDGPDQLQQVLPHCFRVRGRLPLLPAVGVITGVDENRADRDRVAVRATMRMVGAVRPERVLDGQPADGTEIRLRVIGVAVPSLALVP